jgi:hypothetical protein
MLDIESKYYNSVSEEMRLETMLGDVPQWNPVPAIVIRSLIIGTDLLKISYGTMTFQKTHDKDIYAYSCQQIVLLIIDTLKACDADQQLIEQIKIHLCDSKIEDIIDFIKKLMNATKGKKLCMSDELAHGLLKMLVDLA